MSNEQDQKQQQPLEGEGSYSATRRYNQHLGDAVDSGDLEAGAEEARQAMEGSEREALERAAEEGKRGPNKKGQTVAPTPQQAQKKAKE
jgi:hypothetical protein